MNLEDYRIYCNSVMNREELGQPASPDGFNTFIKLAVNEFYKEQYQLFIKMWMQTRNGISLPYYTLALNEQLALTIIDTAPTSEGTVDLPSDFLYPVSVSLLINNDRYVNAKIVGPEQMDFEIYKDADDVTEYPVVLVTNSTLEGVFGNNYPVRVRYFKTITEPEYDYCVDDTTGRIIYMPPGYTLEDDGTGTTVLKDESGTVVKSGVSHVDDPTLPYSSQSVEVPFSDSYFNEIAGKVIEVMAAKTREGGIINYAKGEQQ